jgi:hypothetical protein
MQVMWGVLREDGQVSYLQGPLPAKMVSLVILNLLVVFLSVDACSFHHLDHHISHHHRTEFLSFSLVIYTTVSNGAVQPTEAENQDK